MVKSRPRNDFAGIDKLTPESTNNPSQLHLHDYHHFLGHKSTQLKLSIILS
jgi:hypothetical protein